MFSLRKTHWIRYQLSALIFGLTFLSLSAVASSYLTLVSSLVPPESAIVKVKPGSDLSERLDRLTLKIISTDSGKIFCGAFQENFGNFQDSLFINKSFGSQAKKNCKGHFADKQVHRVFPKQYYLVMAPTDDRVADGWTTPHNETVIFISKNNFTDQRLTQTLIHEMAVTLDRKEQIGFGGLIDYPQIGIQEDAAACDMIKIVRDAYMKQTMTAIRAFEMEKQISAELGIVLPPNFAAWNEISCENKLNFMGPFLQPFKTVFAGESLVNIFYDQPFCLSSGKTPETFAEGASNLARLTLSFTDGRKVNACEFMTAGLPFYPGTSFRGGPGPRIGGGGWKKLDEFKIDPISKTEILSEDKSKPTEGSISDTSEKPMDLDTAIEKILKTSEVPDEK